MKELKRLINENASKEKAKLLQRYFKTGKGEYGEGDIFIGIVVPVLRKIAKSSSRLTLEDIQILLDSKIHEERLIGLLILLDKFRKANEIEQGKIFNFYLANTKNINNWDLVDLSCRDIVGSYLFDKDRRVLYKLAKSENLWEKRISIISTFYFIARNQFDDTLRISEILMNDKHDLIHKAVGWALREVGKKNLKVEEDFLKINYKKMPRVMLRYAIERFDEKKRKAYLNGEI